MHTPGNVKGGKGGKEKRKKRRSKSKKNKKNTEEEPANNQLMKNVGRRGEGGIIFLNG
jgi:hypothetical protein